MYPRHRLDIGFGDLARAALACAWARDAAAQEERLIREVGEAVAAVSLRSGFELLLDALELPRGSEIALSAITHPDMAGILERHGLVPVPVDIDPRTLSPRIDLLERAVTSRTRAILVAHLFGGRVDLAPVAAVARRERLLLIEDCAQAFAGAVEADPYADVSLFSFGSIKTCTALGGGVVVARDPALLARMRELRRAWPRQKRREYLRRVVWFVGLHVLEQPLVYGVALRAAARLGYDVDAVVNESVRGLRPPSGEAREAFDGWLRRRPSAPLLVVVRRRLRRFDAERLAARARSGEELRRALPDAVGHPGAARKGTHWVFPVTVSDPSAAVASLRAAGFDATPATTSIAAIEPPEGREPPTEAARLMRTILFVPAYPEIPRAARLELAVALGALR